MKIRKLLALSLITSISYISLQFASLPELPLTPPMQKALNDITEASRTKSADQVIALIEKTGKQEGSNLLTLLTRPDRSGITLFEYISQMKDYSKIQDRLSGLVHGDINFLLFAKSQINKGLKESQDVLKEDIAKGEAYLKANINREIANLAQTSSKTNDIINNIHEASKKDMYSNVKDPKHLKNFYEAAIILRIILNKVSDLMDIFD